MSGCSPCLLQVPYLEYGMHATQPALPLRPKVNLLLRHNPAPAWPVTYLPFSWSRLGMKRWAATQSSQ